MKKIFWGLGLVVLLLVFPNRCYAQNVERFDVSIDGVYTVSENGKTVVQEHVEITNRDDFIYAPSYTINLGLDDISGVQVTNKSGSIPFTVKDAAQGKDIEIRFPERIVGAGNKNIFEFQFETSKIAKKKGAIWEIDIPGLSSPESYKNYTIELSLPESFGVPSLIKPEIPVSASGVYTFDKSQIRESGIFMTFGKLQFYDLKLSYHLTNPNLFPITTEIALPANTSYQTVLINSINPRPLNVYPDSDGNWLAEYSLSPSTDLDIVTLAQIEIRDEPRESTPPQKGMYTARAEFWNVDSAKISALARQLQTPEQIYQYVVKTLSYNYEKTGEKNVRLGALKSLEIPTNAVCLEFTDLFVSLARAAGIPARAVEGYAYTDNTKLRPLSLESDVLHAWPEYYDEKLGAWIMVDPTWGNTTGGIDYFKTLDFDHIAFVTKGSSSTYPIPAGGYKTNKNTKDLTVRFVEASLFKVNPKITISHTFPEHTFPGFPIRAAVTIKNNGNAVVPSSELSLSSSSSKKIARYEIDAIPPFGTVELPISTERLPFLTTSEHSFTISYAGHKYYKTVHSSFIPRDSIYILGGVFLIVGSILFSFAIRAWRLHLQK